MDWDLDHVAVRPDGTVTSCGLHRLFDVSSQLLCVADFAGRLVAVNPAWTALLGWPAEQLVGHAYLELVHPDDVEATTANAQRLLTGEPVEGFENRYRHAAGGYRWLRWSSVPDVEEERIYAVVRDVTEDRRRQARLEEIERVSGVGTWDLDLDTGRTGWSAGVHAIYGTDPATFRPGVDDGLEHYPPEARAALEPAVSRLIEHGEPYDLELPFRTLHGEHRWIRTTGRARQRDGRVIEVYGAFHDITPQRERHLELTRARDQLTDTQQIARLGHFAADLDLGEARWSPLVAEIFGWSPRSEPITLAEMRTVVHPEDLPRFEAALREVEEQGRVDVVHRIVRPDGQVRSVRVLGTFDAGPHGGLRRLRGTVQDVTDLTEAQAALRSSEQRLQRVLTATNDGWWDTDLTTGRVVHSDRWLQLHGYEPGELPDTYDTWRALTHPDDLRAIDAVTEQVIARRESTFAVSGRARHKQGHLVPVVIRGLIEYDAHGRPVRISGATTDVSERHDARAATEALVSTVSHELRTPLTVIGGALETLASPVTGPLDPVATQLVEVARSNTLRLRALIDDLLDLDGLRERGDSFTLAPHLLTDLVERAVEDIAPTALAGDTAVAVTRSAPVWVEVDPGRVGQVLTNLLANATRYAPPGSLVELQVHAKNGWARTEVVDHGAGVPPEFRERVFERFAQADPSDARSRGGSGLGLAICQQIVERLGGRIGFDSQPGHTCFWFDLPTIERPGDGAGPTS